MSTFVKHWLKISVQYWFSRLNRLFSNIYLHNYTVKGRRHIICRYNIPYVEHWFNKEYVGRFNIGLVSREKTKTFFFCVATRLSFREKTKTFFLRGHEA